MQDAKIKIVELKDNIRVNVVDLLGELEAFRRFLNVGEDITDEDLKRVGSLMGILAANVGALRGYQQAQSQGED